MNILVISECYSDERNLNGSVLRLGRYLPILESISTLSIKRLDPTYLLSGKKIESAFISQINREHYDICIFDVSQLSKNLRLFRKIKHKKYFLFLDSFFHIYKSTDRLLIKLVAILGMVRELSVLSEEKCIYLGKDEVDQIPFFKNNARTIPFYIEKKENVFFQDGPLIMVGNFNFWPNRLMLDKLVGIANVINREIHIFGSNVPTSTYLPNIICRGYVEKIGTIYTGARALLYPISYGTGIKNKVLEAAAYGIPTIGYPGAFTNLDFLDGVDCVVSNTINELVLAAESRDLSSISKNVHKKVELYSFENIRNALLFEFGRR